MDVTKIKSIIETHAQGDKEFIVDFASLCRINYQDFIEGMNSGVSQKNTERLKKVTHKIKSLNRLFEFEELEAKLAPQKEDEKYFLKHPDKLEEVVEMCQKIIGKLKTIKE